MSIGNLVEATHICSYMCALSSNNADMRGDWCLLWEDVEAAGVYVGLLGCALVGGCGCMLAATGE
jgi:hypothetical protein